MPNPWIKFFPTDWLGEKSLRMCSLAARGLWIECMCVMHDATPYGHLTVNGRPATDTQLALMTGTPPEQVADLLAELESAGVFSRNGKGVIYSRRMTRDEKKAKNAVKNGKNGGNPTLRKQKGNLPPVNREDKPPDNPLTCAHKPEARSQKPEKPSGLKLTELGDACLDALGMDPGRFTGFYGPLQAFLDQGHGAEAILEIAKEIGGRPGFQCRGNPIGLLAKVLPEALERRRQSQPGPRGPDPDFWSNAPPEFISGIKDELRKNRFWWLAGNVPTPDEPGWNGPPDVAEVFREVRREHHPQGGGR
jgi:hypothetical protein